MGFKAIYLDRKRRKDRKRKIMRKFVRVAERCRTIAFLKT